MARITLKGSPITTVGHLPEVGKPAPEFTGVKADLSDAHLKDYKGKKVILNIFPSLDTPTCAKSVRQFHLAADKLKDIAILCISCDLPFAQSRFCGAEDINNITTLSMFRHPEFGKDYGVTITDGVLWNLFSRAIVIIDENGKVIYTEQVPEIANEPNYAAALKAVS